MKIIKIPIGEKIEHNYGEFEIKKDTSELLIIPSHIKGTKILDWSYDLSGEFPKFIGGGYIIVKDEIVDELIKKYGYKETNYDYDNSSNFVKFKPKKNYIPKPIVQEYKKYIVILTSKEGYTPNYEICEVININYDDVTLKKIFNLKPIRYSKTLLNKLLVFQSNNIDKCIEYVNLLLNRNKYNL